MSVPQLSSSAGGCICRGHRRLCDVDLDRVIGPRLVVHRIWACIVNSYTPPKRNSKACVVVVNPWGRLFAEWNLRSTSPPQTPQSHQQ